MRKLFICVATALLLATALLHTGGAAAHDEREHLAAPAPESALFEPPEPGSYELPAIRTVAQHRLLGSDGVPAPLLDLEPGEVAVVSFVYRSCADAGGCPAALALLRRLDRELAAAPELHGRARLVTCSFDPARDTPGKMAELAGMMQPKSDWRFFTAADEAAIAPVLDDFDQDVLRELAADGESPLMNHLLRVFLVDSQHAVRNVYSANFMDWRVVLNDVKTLVAESAP